MIKFIDLFAGTGGIRLAFEQAITQCHQTCKCVKSVEIDKNACETYKTNFGDDPAGDVRQITDIAPFDVMLAGFPCQAFSYAGKQKGFADTRGTLFFEVERLLEKYRPKLCFLENVRGLTSHDHGKTFKTIIDHLQELGYHIEYRLINASTLGVPQNRTRIYIVCVRDMHPALTIESDIGAADSKSFKYIQGSLFHKNYKQLLVKDILEDDPPEEFNCSDWFVERLSTVLDGDLSKLHGVRLIDTRGGNSIHSWQLGIKGKCTKSEIEFMELFVSNRRKHKFGTHQDGKALSVEQIKTFYTKKNLSKVLNGLLKKGYIQLDDEGKVNLVCGNMSFEVFKFLDPDSVSITLTSSDCNRLGVYHNGRVRRITPRECARIQGYPDSYMLHQDDSCSYKQLGNAVCVPVIKELFVDLFTNTHGLLESLTKKS